MNFFLRINFSFRDIITFFGKFKILRIGTEKALFRHLLKRKMLMKDIGTVEKRNISASQNYHKI